MQEVIETQQNIQIDLGVDGYKIILRIRPKRGSIIVLQLKPSEARKIGGVMVSAANKLLGEITSIAGSISGRQT